MNAISKERMRVLRTQARQATADLLALEQHWTDCCLATSIAVGAVSSWFGDLCSRHGIAFAPVGNAIDAAYRFALEARCLALLEKVSGLRECVSCRSVDGSHEGTCEVKKLVADLTTAKRLRDERAAAETEEASHSSR